MHEPTASPLIGPDDSHLAPVALSGVPKPPPAQPPAGKKTLAAIDLLSGKPIPAPSQPGAKAAKTKTLAQLAEEVFAEGKDE